MCFLRSSCFRVSHLCTLFSTWKEQKQFVSFTQQVACEQVAERFHLFFFTTCFSVSKIKTGLFGFPVIKSGPIATMEVVWVKDNVFCYWFPAKRVEQDELTEDMRKRLDEANPNKKKKKDYVVQFSNGDFKIVGKGDKVRPFGEEKETVKLMTESITLIKKYPTENNPEKTEELRDWLEKYGDAVIHFEKLVNPYSDVSWIRHLIKVATPAESNCSSENAAATSVHTQFGACEMMEEQSEMGPETNEAKPGVEEESKSPPAGPSFSTFGVSPLTPSSLKLRCPFCSRTRPRYSLSAHMKNCRERNSKMGKRGNAKKSKKRVEQEVTVDQNADAEHGLVMEIRVPEVLNDELKTENGTTDIVGKVEVDKKKDVTEADLNDEIITDEKKSSELPETGGKLQAEQIEENQFEVENQRHIGPSFKKSKPSASPPPKQSKVPNQPEAAAEDPKNSEKKPAFVVTRGVHVVPVENEDKSITCGVWSLENSSDYDEELWKRFGLLPGEPILTMHKVEPVVSDERMSIKNLHEMEAVVLDRDVNDPNEIVSAFAERCTSSDSAKSQNNAGQKNQEPKTIGDLGFDIGDGETYIYLANQDGVLTNLHDADIPPEFVMKIMELYG